MSTGGDLPLSRELAIRCVLGHVKATDVSVSSLGGNSREVYMVYKESGADIGRNFFCIGAMGHTFALACGIAMGFSSGRVFCIDGDGSFLMHIGNNAVLAGMSQRKVIHVVMYNGLHSSTGQHPLMIKRDNFLTVAEGLPYELKFLVNNMDGLERACKSADRNTLIVVAVNDSVSKDLPRPTESSQELKEVFMHSISALSKS
jgi:phosphonopyruvate decarboxylase